MRLPFVSIITVNYNGKKYLKNLFDSLYSLTYPKNQLEFIMIDNGSTDNSVEFVYGNFPEVKIKKNEINNYCRANNLGIKIAKGNYLAILNNDTLVDKDWLVELVKAIVSDSSIGAVGSKILFMDGRIESAGHVELSNYYWVDRGVTEKDNGQYDELREVDSLCGCAVLYRREALEDINNFDEDFNMYLEDVDISIRLKKKGWKIIYVPKSSIRHMHHGTAHKDSALFYTEKNRLFLIAKHYPKELNKALLGRGYFTVQNCKEMHSDLYKILPDLIIKLEKHHKIEIVKDVLSELFEELKRISSFENNILLNRVEDKLSIIYRIRNIVKICLKKIFRNNPRIIHNLRMIEKYWRKKITSSPNLIKKKINSIRNRNLKRGVNVIGYLTAELGMGEAARANVNCLRTAGVDISLINISSYYSRQYDINLYEFSKNNPYYINLIHLNADSFFGIYLEKGRVYFNNKYNIGFWTWELSDFPDEWLDSFRYCDEIWTPSTFTLASIAKKSSVPVLKIPHAVKVNKLKDVNRSYFRLKENDFVFLFIFDFLSYFERKNPLAIIKAFKQSFSPFENVRLVIKCSNSSFDTLAMSSMKEASKGFNIDIIDNYLYKDEVNTLMSLCNSYISLHRSEGFGLTMAEAMFLEKPVIATGYSGNTDFMNINNSYLVRYKLVGIDKDIGPYKKGSLWAEPDIEHAAELMRYVYENGQVSKETGKIASMDIRRELSYDVIGNEIKSRIGYICRRNCI